MEVAALENIGEGGLSVGEDSGKARVIGDSIFVVMKHETKPMLPPRYQYDPMSAKLTSGTQVRELTAEFKNFSGCHLLPTEEALIARLECQRIEQGAVRAYIIDPRRQYERLLIEYSAYIEAVFGGGHRRVAVLGPTKKTAKLPTNIDKRCLHFFSGRRPDHIRGFGSFRAAVLVCADRLTVHSNRDRTGRRAIKAFNSAMMEDRNTSLIFIGESYSRWSRLFSIMYRRICGSPFPSDGTACNMPPMTDYMAIDVRMLEPVVDDTEPGVEVQLPDLLFLPQSRAVVQCCLLKNQIEIMSKDKRVALFGG